MPITLLCPRLTCRAVLCVPDHVRGKYVKCGECGVTFLVPLPAPPRPTKSKTPQDAEAEPPTPHNGA